MNYKKELNINIEIMNRKLLELKDYIKTNNISKGQIKFIEVYMSVALDQINKSLNILDKNKYKEVLTELDI
jgi:hypothetical protein